MPVILDEGICVRQWDWSETSQTASVFCRELGLIRGLAKGSRRPASRYSGGIELLTRAGLGVITRPNSDLSLITEWDLLETFPALRKSLRAHYAAMYIADLIHHALHDRDPHTILYDAFLDALRVLGANSPASPELIEPALLRLQWAALTEMGYRPVLDDPAFREATPTYVRFSPSRGGVLPQAADLTEDRTWRVRSTTIRALLMVIEPPTESDTAGAQAGPPLPPNPPPDAVHRANCLLAAYLRHVLGREMRTMALLFGKRLPL